MNPKVDFYFNTSNKWFPEIIKLRTILLNTTLNEELKWGVPCYTLPNTNGEKQKTKNIVLIHDFKTYCALLFFKGALLKDEGKVLIQQTPHVQAARQMRFTQISEIEKSEHLIKAYVFEAIEIEKLGLKVTLKKAGTTPILTELEEKFTAYPNLKLAFEALSPGRQRAYLLHFSAPKQAQTKISRIEKCIPLILDGKGLNEDYQSKN